jgi:hypothetical protein
LAAWVSDEVEKLRVSPTSVGFSGKVGHAALGRSLVGALAGGRRERRLRNRPGRRGGGIGVDWSQAARCCARRTSVEWRSASSFCFSVCNAAPASPSSTNSLAICACASAVFSFLLELFAQRRNLRLVRAG